MTSRPSSPERAGARSSWVRPLLRPILLRQVLLLSLFVNLLILAVPLFVLQVYDRVVGHAGLTTLQALVIGMAGALVFDFVLRQARSRAMQRVAVGIDVDIGRRLFAKIAALPLRSLESRPAAFWQVLFRDVETVRNTLSGSTAVLLCDLPFILLFFALIVVIATPIAWVLLAMLGLIVVVALVSLVSVGRASTAERATALSRDALVSEIVAGRTTAKALDLKPVLSAAWEERQADLVEAALHRGARADAFHNLGTTLSMLTTVALTSFGALAILEQQMTVGALVAANILGSRFIGPVIQLVGNWRNFAAFRDSARRLGEVFGAAEDRSTVAVERPRPEGRLAAENLVFRYEEDLAPVVKGVTLRLGPGGLHAILGQNGSGKTTLLKLLLGLYAPSEGRVLLDKADIAQFSRGQLAAWIGYVPQDCFLFAGSIRDNITKGFPEASDAQVLAAAEKAGVHRFVSELPDGYATEIGEGGGRLSGGQRQRIAIARALLRDPPVLLLDEPTANLDRQAEEELRDQLLTLSGDHTIIMATHSALLLSACHSIMGLQAGRIAVAGSAQDVLARLSGEAAPPTAQGTAQGAAQGAEGTRT